MLSTARGRYLRGRLRGFIDKSRFYVRQRDIKVSGGSLCLLLALVTVSERP